ncbi:MAG: ribosome biogenesis GTPase Der [Verrucomicrobiales bacterium]|nr:ribosome biogenesis GTPase Der [Verrucomicrobiales bacterium]MEC7357560.1 ribosome biogenesis GTPase Der [Verrucomicrobiota bacterium]
MQSPNSYRIAAIVGRPNVGKSAIFNRLAGRRISIVHDEPGVTRDRITATCKLASSSFTIIDTGGIGSNPDDSFSTAITQEADIAMESAELILFVVDGIEGLTPVDQELSSYLRKADKTVFLLVNKIDEKQNIGLADDFSSLGFDKTFAISAAHNSGLSELANTISTTLPEDINPSTSNSPNIKIALAGRPNVGKSSLINALLNNDRTIVSDIAGTTRDAVDVPLTHGGIDYTLIDTAGLRSRNKQNSSIEVFSGMRTKSSIRRSDICALVVDAAQGATAQDRKIANIIRDSGKPCLVIANKFDLYHPDAAKSDRLASIQDDIAEELFFIPYAPVIAASAKTGESVKRFYFAIEQIRKSSWEGLNTGALNRLLQDSLTAHPPPAGKGGKRFKLLYATMAREKEREKAINGANFILFCNKKSLLPGSYERYLENKIRDNCAYTGIPISFTFREREARKRARKN